MKSLGRLSSTLVLAAALSGGASASDYQARALIKAVDQAVLSAELSAKVIRLPLKAGDGFKTGDLLIGLECSLYEAEALKVAAEQKAAVSKLENVEKLNRLRSIGAIEVALAKSHLDQVEASLRIAQLNAERCYIKAPYDGKVISHEINRFETVTPQQELIQIVNNQQLKAESIAPADWLDWLKIDMPVKLHVDRSSIVAEGYLSAISPAIDPVSQTVVLHIKLPLNPDLVPGMSATAALDVPVEEPVENPAADLADNSADDLDKKMVDKGEGPQK